MQEKEVGVTPNTVTMESIRDIIQDDLTSYYVFPNTTLTVCCVTLRNGYTVTGESACADPDNFNKELGQKYAFEAAVSKIWQLEGYLLKQKLFMEQ